ncbi:pilus assembly protein [Litorivivens sp.]|uniref:pilus assembly protein n=1 Tax=Litorivivens sp. TaxID=2020868 RepID=UPI0035672451
MKSQLTTQRGAVLVIVLIMVGIFMVIVTSLVASSSINFRIAGNQQYRMEAKSAAKNALEAYVSNPANFGPSPPTAAKTYEFNFNGDTDSSGNPVIDMRATVPPPVCATSKPIPQSELDLDDPDDAQCAGSVVSTQGMIGASGSVGAGASWCSNVKWQISAEVDDAATGVALAMVQGISMRATTGTPCPASTL